MKQKIMDIQKCLFIGWFSKIAPNVRRLGEGCLTNAQFSQQTQWQLLPNRCYVLGGLSALNLI